jgi:type II secretory pathway pseudopilin PulG
MSHTAQDRTHGQPGGSAIAFTLVELLVVVAIVSALVGILLPSMAAARRETRRVVCMSNLRQLGVANQLYLDASNDFFWRYYTTLAAGRLWWFGYEAGGPGTGTNRPLDVSAGVLAKNLDNTERLQCPDFNYNDPDLFKKFAHHSASYGFNLMLGPASTGFPTLRRTDFMRRLDSVFVFADGIHFDANPGYNEGHYIQYSAGASSASGYAHFRHNQLAQFTLMDGHVESQAVSNEVFKTIGGGPAANLVARDGTNSIYGN